MILHPFLINPNSIAVIGASDNLASPGGKLLKNLINHDFKGNLYAVNPKKSEIQGIKVYQQVSDLPEVDLAIIAIAANYCVETVAILAKEKNTRGFIIVSAGFSEQDEEGAKLEKEIVQIVDEVGGTILGPNNIGLLNTHYAGVFTTPIPKLDPQGVDFISGSGATAVFIIEAAAANGLAFNAVFSVGNSAQIGVEEVLAYLDETFDDQQPKIKLLYIESIDKPQKLLKHAISLRKKGCRIAAIKAGSSEAGSRAASSHTGAIANSDVAVDALFEKAGIIRCHGRSELIHVAGLLTYPELKGKNIAIITHAGGPAVMLTDVLSKNNLEIPPITSPKVDELKELLYPGSSVANPIDFLATGNAAQLESIIDYCERYFDEIEGMAVIFGSPGLFSVEEVYEVLHQKIITAKKPIYPILPSVVNVKEEIQAFIAKGHFAFFDEVLFGKALAKVYHQKNYALPKPKIDQKLRKNLQNVIAGTQGYLSPEKIQQLFALVDIPFVKEWVLSDSKQIDAYADSFTYPVVMKVVGPIHKTDVGGVILNVQDEASLRIHFVELMQIADVQAILIQPMRSGLELFIGVNREVDFGHLLLFGMGGTQVEIIKDLKVGLAPLSAFEIKDKLKELKSYKLLKGYRGKAGIDIPQFVDLIKKVSDLVNYLPEIAELDINPLIANEKSIRAVDARVKIEKV